MRETINTFQGSTFRDDWKTDWIESAPLQEGVEYAFRSGGKRIRALLCLKVCEALNGDQTAAELFARAIETHHNMTLIHDDIMDRDVKRRDKESVWKRFGVEHGVLTGDGLYALGFSYLSDLSYHLEPAAFQQLLRVYTDMSLEMADGQAMDLQFRDRDDITRDEYMRMTRKKTGSLFIAALSGSAIIAGADGEIHDAMANVGHLIGPAFQIRDDVIDLIGEKQRDRQGADVAEGKRSLVVVLAVQRLDGRKRDELLQILNRPRENTTQPDIDRAIDLFRAVGAIDDANAVSQQLIAEATDTLAAIDEYDVSELEELADFLVERTF